MKSKPNIIIVDDLTAIFDNAIKEMDMLRNDTLENNESRLFKALFLYSYSIFESSLSLSYKQILFAFPGKMNKKTFDISRYKKNIISYSLTNKLIEEMAFDFSRDMSYGKIDDIMKEYGGVLGLDIRSVNIKDINIIKNIRIDITHNNTIGANIQQQEVLKWIEIISDNLFTIRKQISITYNSYTRFKLIKDSWDYLFSNAGLLNFENNWVMRGDDVWHYNGDCLKRIHGMLSSSEKTFLILFMANYGTICNKYFTLRDLGPLSGIGDKDKVAFISELFSKYPNLLHFI